MTRLPRPHGSTFLSLKYQQSQQEQDREALLIHLVNLYTLEGFRWNGKPTSIPQLASILQVPQTQIMDLVSQTGQNMGSLASPQNIKNTLQSIITLSTSYAIQDRGLILDQLDKLAVSQDNKYKPFITAEYNKVLKLVLDSNKNIMDSYKTFFTSTNPTTNILNVIGTPEDDGKDYVTPDQALQIIHQKRLPDHNPTSVPANRAGSPLSETAELADQLHDEYGIGDFVDVRERRSGTEALQAPEPTHKASKPPSLPTDQADNEEDGGFARRGIQVEDTDAIE